ncbi:hypothetical protein F441_10725 [Phytophthora nicotianae CJ01A1]|uniref:Uncharacterized protein n=1 Tax=Phytophthora nicotianae CJ01A1 TaxID=1317063 RepID=W2WVW8_PHYNI|nr:hypothetical protein F441_10725 [Phytophthora nicotianae CJ01A1]
MTTSTDSLTPRMSDYFLIRVKLQDDTSVDFGNASPRDSESGIYLSFESVNGFANLQLHDM